MKKFKFYAKNGMILELSFNNWSDAAKYFYDRKHFYVSFLISDSDLEV